MFTQTIQTKLLLNCRVQLTLPIRQCAPGDDARPRGWSRSRHLIRFPPFDTQHLGSLMGDSAREDPALVQLIIVAVISSRFRNCRHPRKIIALQWTGPKNWRVAIGHPRALSRAPTVFAAKCDPAGGFLTDPQHFSSQSQTASLRERSPCALVNGTPPVG